MAEQHGLCQRDGVVPARAGAARRQARRELTACRRSAPPPCANPGTECDVRRILFVCVMAMMMAEPVGASNDPDAGISGALATDRAVRVSDVAYGLQFEVPDQKGRAVRGRADIRFTLADAARPLSLDFAAAPAQVRSLSIGGRAVRPALVNGHIVLPADALVKGENRVEIEFTAGDTPLNREEEFLYTLFVPARAHEAFPCFDQPDLKARFSLELWLPSDWTALTNAPETGRTAESARVRVRFAETKQVEIALGYRDGVRLVKVPLRTPRSEIADVRGWSAP